MFFVVRFLQIGMAVYGYLAWWGLVHIGLWRSRFTPAQGFSRMLQKLGTPFVKLGQGLSMHRELLPDDYIAALTDLQDHVQPFPGAMAVQEIETALGGNVNDVFEEFSIEPLAAASIAQIHVARLHDGRRVVVKVRRPRIKRQVEQDLRIVRLLLRIALLVAPSLKRFDPLGLIREVHDNLHKEMDFRQETRNVQRFTEVFRDSPTIYVPPAVPELVAESVMVQVMSGGLRVDDPRIKERGSLLAQVFVDAFLYQFFVARVFHGDPHPGNLFVMYDNRLCLARFRADRIHGSRDAAGSGGTDAGIRPSGC